MLVGGPGVSVYVCVCVSKCVCAGGFSMEATALYTFRATEGDELSFNKGDMLKVRGDMNSCNCLSVHSFILTA